MRARHLVPLLMVALGSSLVVPPVGAEEYARVGSLLSQDQYVAGLEGSSFAMSLFVEGSSSLGDRAPTSLLVTAHQPVESRRELHEVLLGTLPSNVDALEFDIAGLCDASGVIDLVVPIEIGTTTSEKLQMSATGIYPVSIALVVGAEVTDRIVTFVERLPEGSSEPETAAPLPTAIFGSIDGAVTLQPDGSTTVTNNDRSSLADLVTVAEALPGFPLTVAVRPETVEGLSRSTGEDAQLLASLQFADSMSFLSMPYVGLDPEDVVGTRFSDVFVDQLRLGEDSLSDSLPLTTTRRTAWVMDRAPTAAEAQLLRDLGFRSILMLPNAQRDEGMELLGFLDPTRLVDLAFEGRGAIEAQVADQRMSDLLTQASRLTTSDSFLVAQHVLADLKLLRREILDRGESLSGRSLVLATNDGSMMSIELLTAVVDTLSASRLVTLVDLDDALSRTAVGLADGRPISVTLPIRSDTVDESPFVTHSLMSSRVSAYASMLPDGDERPTLWRRLVDVLVDQRLDSASRQDYVEVIVADTAMVADGLVAPTPATFTLGGRSSQLRLSMRNDGPTDLTIRLRLASPKLLFPDGEPVVLLAAGSLTPIEIDVEARSNGRFPVTVQVVTPDGGVALTDPIVFTARVNALAGLGQVVTGVALLLLATWWVHHWRGQYRRKQAEVLASTVRHPSSDHLG